MSPKVKEAITKSRISERARQTVLVYHTTRLDNLLLSNGLERIKIKPDGNSFLKVIIERKELTSMVNTLWKLELVLSSIFSEKKFVFMSSMTSSENFFTTPNLVLYEAVVLFKLREYNVFLSLAKTFNNSITAGTIAKDIEFSAVNARSIVSAFAMLSCHGVIGAGVGS